MNKLHSFAFCALVTPVITFGAGSVLAQQAAGQEIDRNEQSTQRDQGTMQSTTRSTQGDLNSQRMGKSDSQEAADQRKMGDKSHMQNRDHMASIPANGMRASALIGAEVSTAIDKDVGPVEDLIVDENGQIVAIVVGVGGFLGMGEKNVAISWDRVTKTSKDDEQVLTIDMTREDLRSAPEFEMEE
ncbi:PRC-barrel domain-containing protein [Haliea sp. E1-2-M8]|uniref:PRC-barrel domain-containing protein n=1 Tax=Haliea sp. E1-2-M8 TaxID=3064706 RepID=UPI0027277428|nr:PRC-barrel domain-containing protein [Haliea sp. E1-2-M8]MDO8862086.1 PRC-barrel domain-containing protein [Haliea sp. E1-2-M8]